MFVSLLRNTSDGTLVNPLPPQQQSKCLQMKQNKMIPIYAADGRSLGFRTIEAAERLVAGGYVKASYGRKKNLRAIWLSGISSLRSQCWR